MRRYAELNPEARDVLLEKANAKEKSLKRITSRDEYLKILDQVDAVLSAVEEELARHGSGRINGQSIKERSIT